MMVSDQRLTGAPGVEAPGHLQTPGLALSELARRQQARVRGLCVCVHTVLPGEAREVVT